MYPFNGHSITTPHNRPVHCPQGVPHVITGIIPSQRRPQQLLEPDGRGPAESGRRRATLGAGATSGGSPCPVRSGSGRISSTQPWSTRCLHEVLSNVSSPWEIRQTLHSCSGRTVGKRSGNGAGCQSDGRGPAESGRRTTSEPGRPLAVRRVLSGPGRDGYLRLNPGRPGASMRFSVTSAPHGRFGRRSTAAAVAPSGNGRETELAASLMAGDRRNLEEGPLSGAGATSGGSPCPVRSGSGRISSTQPWSTRCLHEVLSIVSSPWEIRQTLHSCSGRTVGKRSGNGAGCQSDGRGPAESGRRTTLEPGRPLAVRRVLSGLDRYLRLNPGRPGASARISISPATRGRSTRCSTDPSGTLSGNGRETELAASLKDEPSAENSVPQFRCIPWANLPVQEMDEMVRTHDRTLAGDEAKSDLSLFGWICCRLTAQPNVHLSVSVAEPVSAQSGSG